MIGPRHSFAGRTNGAEVHSTIPDGATMRPGTTREETPVSETRAPGPGFLTVRQKESPERAAPHRSRVQGCVIARPRRHAEGQRLNVRTDPKMCRERCGAPTPVSSIAKFNRHRTRNSINGLRGNRPRDGRVLIARGGTRAQDKTVQATKNAARTVSSTMQRASERPPPTLGKGGRTVCREDAWQSYGTTVSKTRPCRRSVSDNFTLAGLGYSQEHVID